MTTTTEVTLTLEAASLDSLLSVLDDLANDHLQKTSSHKLALKFTGVAADDLPHLVDDLETYLEKQSKVTSKITTKQVRDVIVTPPGLSQQPLGTFFNPGA